MNNTDAQLFCLEKIFLMQQNNTYKHKHKQCSIDI